MYEEAKKQVELRKEFYSRCADILGIEHQWTDHPIVPKFDRMTGECLGTSFVPRGRWYGREPGSGRYAGYGTIRMFSAACIQVNLTHPRTVQKLCTSPEEVYDLLRDLLSQPS